MSAMLEHPMAVTLSAAEWLVFLGWVGGIAGPSVSGPAEDIVVSILKQLPELTAALKIDP